MVPLVQQVIKQTPRAHRAWRHALSVVKRRHGLNRCRYKSDAGMQRWVGLGIIADTLITIGRALAKPQAT